MGTFAPDLGSLTERLRRTVRLALPVGGRLPPEVWARRHRWLLGLLWAHVPAIVGFGLLEGARVEHLLWGVAAVAALATVAGLLGRRRRLSSFVVALGLATCSALLVHLAGGNVEMHFHFFVMVAVVTLYQDWPPLLAFVAYVVAHHGIVGAIAPKEVFDHPAAAADPLTWALIHGGFILAMSTVSVLSWRLNETTAARLADREEKLAHAQEVAGLGSWHWDVPAGHLEWSPELHRLFGVGPHFRPTFDAFASLVHPEDRETMMAAVSRTHRTLEPFSFDFRAVLPDGRVRWMHSQGEVVEADGPVPVVLYGTAHDITPRKLAESELRTSQRAAQLIQDVAVAANQASTLDHAMREGLTAVSEYTGWPLGRLHLVTDDGTRLRPSGIWHLGDPGLSAFRDVVCSSPAPPDADLPAAVFGSGVAAWGTGLGRADGLLRAAAAEYGIGGSFALPVVAAHEVVAVLEFFARGETGPDAETVALLENVGTQLGRVVERKRAQDALAHLAHHDPLTTLPNRTLFLDRLGQTLAQLERRDSSIAVLFMDLDGFKEINDSLGHNAGDDLLVALADRLLGTVREGDTVARFGGDEFAILCVDLDDDSRAVQMAERIAEALDEPFIMGPDGGFVLTASIGIAVARSGEARAPTPSDLLRDADLAMYRAKEQGRAGHALFDGSMHAAATERLSLGTALRRAVDVGELRLHYQPQVVLDGTASMAGVEALLRWEHPDRGLVSPADFIPVAENTGLIVPIGDWVIEAACLQLAAWQAQGFPGLAMCVNVSARQLARPAIVGVVARALAAGGIPPETLCLEITESILMEDPDHYAETLADLKALGVNLSVDDFGTGYSSLAYLQRLPADFLKIDKSFVDELGASARAAAIVRTIVDLAHSLDMVVVAEGVESAAQADELTRLGCDQAQGFLFARPAPADEALAAFSVLPGPVTDQGTSADSASDTMTSRSSGSRKPASTAASAEAVTRAT